MLAEVYGAGPPSACSLRQQFALGRERTIEQDPAFAMRILVDIAIKALSPAINDPTTAVQVLDHVEAFLGAVARTEGLQERYALGYRGGVTRIVGPGRSWKDYLELAVTEVRDYGAVSTQVCRRLHALLDTMHEVAPADRRPVVREDSRPAAAVDATFADRGHRELAHESDRQGIGGRVTRPVDPVPTSSDPVGSPPGSGDGDGHRGA